MDEVSMKIIGITGPTGAGKTTALHALSTLGAHIIDCDEVYHRLLAESDGMKARLGERFGDVFDPQGGLDRKKLGNLVFADSAALLDLNAITHKFVGEQVDAELARARAEHRPAAAIDAIALFESGEGEKCDVTVAVTAPPELRVARIMAREGISEQYAKKRVAAQKGDDFFRAHCDFVLVNDCASCAEFEAKALALFESMI